MKKWIIKCNDIIKRDEYTSLIEMIHGCLIIYIYGDNGNMYKLDFGSCCCVRKFSQILNPDRIFGMNSLKKNYYSTDGILFESNDAIKTAQKTLYNVKKHFIIVLTPLEIIDVFKSAEEDVKVLEVVGTEKENIISKFNMC